MVASRQSKRLVHASRRITHSAIVLGVFVMVTVAVAGSALYRHNQSHAAGGWLSGSSGEQTANGAFGAWRGEPDLIAGTWSDDGSTLNGEYANWNGDVDLGITGMVGSWSNSANGGADSSWDGAMSNIRTWLSRHTGHTVYARFAYEYNGSFMNYHVSSDDIQNYITAFRRFADKCHAISGCKVTWGLNDGTSVGYDVRTSYPGSAYVDVVGVDSYNQYPWVNTASSVTAKFNGTNSDGSPLGIEAWRQYAQTLGKPLAIPEWANCNGSNCAGGGGDAPVYIQMFHDWAANNAGTGAGNVIYEIFFNVASYGQFEIYPDNHGATQSANMYVSLNWGNGGLSGGGTVTPAPTPVPTPQPGVQQAGNLLAGKTFSSTVPDSTTEPGHPLSYINDGNQNTRWISQPTSPVSISTDMGASYTLSKVSVLWAGDTINNFQIQLSPDNSTWTTVVSGATNNTTPQYVDYTSFNATPTGRYFRLVGIDRWNSSYGNSIWEIGAYGAAAGGDKTLPTVALTAPAAGAALKGTVNVTGTASDNTGVSKVELLVDGAVKATNNSSSASFSWNSTTVADGSHSLALRATDAAGNSATSPAITVSINNVSAPPAPTVQSFSATPASLTAGGRSTLNWATTGVASCSITPGGPQNTTSTSWQTPALSTPGSTTYTLDCVNPAGAHVTQTTTVTVSNPSTPPAKPLLVASSTIITSGSSVTVSWSSQGATSCALTPGNISSSGASGSYVTSPLTSNTTYRVTCSNAAGSTQSDPLTITISSTTVQSSEPKIISLFADPARIAAGQTSTIYWTTTGVAANGCNLNPSPLNTASANGTWTTPYLLGSKSYTLTCVGGSGQVVSQSVTVVVNDITSSTPAASVTPVTNTANSSQALLKASDGEVVTNAAVATTVSGLVTLDPSNVTSSIKERSITKTEYYEGQAIIQTDTVAPFTLDTTKLSNGQHTITERTYYNDGSRSEVTRVLSVNNTKAVAQKTNNTAAAAIILSLLVLGALGGGVFWFIRLRSVGQVTISGIRSKYGNTIDTSLIDPK